MFGYVPADEDHIQQVLGGLIAATEGEADWNIDLSLNCTIHVWKSTWISSCESLRLG